MHVRSPHPQPSPCTRGYSGGVTGATAIALAVPFMPLLERLRVANTEMGPEGQAKYASVLGDARSLLCLDAGQNDLNIPVPGADTGTGAARDSEHDPHAPARSLVRATSPDRRGRDHGAAATARTYASARPQSASARRRRGQSPPRSRSPSPRRRPGTAGDGEPATTAHSFAPGSRAAQRVETYGYLPLWKPTVRRLLASLHKAPRLQELRLCSAKMGDVSAGILGAALPLCSSLTSLDLSGTSPALGVVWPTRMPGL